MTSLTPEPVIEPVVILDYAVGATTVDLLIQSEQELSAMFEKAKSFKRHIFFDELPRSIKGRHFQAHIGKSKIDSDLKIRDNNGQLLAYQVHLDLNFRPRRTRITSATIAGEPRELVLSHDRISLRKLSQDIPTVSKVSVFNDSIVIEQSSHSQCTIELIPRSRKPSSSTISSDSSGKIEISKTWLANFTAFDESMLFNIMDKETGKRLRHENPEIGSPRDLYSYSAMRYTTSSSVVSLRPYWTTDGYLSLKVVAKQARA
ncbi:hypothetical protein [Glutamicibacter nicotianae]|uniref:hypothetical protein n=1 Tax=Glutamicibacter nicotianae TaxID=37929 RepID=UPI00195CA5F6|nr:hypothetical protein [Glutamicibacter nicotianae]MBM7768256.1 hypothetical protein [Glutamicibacter nicotianae]